MATCLYVNPDPASAAIGNSLGCGWVHEVPPAYVGLATAPCVIVAGAGITAVLPDDGTLTAGKVSTALAPILAAEQAARDAVAAQTANAGATEAALTVAMPRLTAIINQGNTLAAQSTAWTIAQQKAVASAMSDLALIERRLIREALNLRDAPD